MTLRERFDSTRPTSWTDGDGDECLLLSEVEAWFGKPPNSIEEEPEDYVLKDKIFRASLNYALEFSDSHRSPKLLAKFVAIESLVMRLTNRTLDTADIGVLALVRRTLQEDLQYKLPKRPAYHRISSFNFKRWLDNWDKEHAQNETPKEFWDKMYDGMCRVVRKDVHEELKLKRDDLESNLEARDQTISTLKDDVLRFEAAEQNANEVIEEQKTKIEDLEAHLRIGEQQLIEARKAQFPADRSTFEAQVIEKLNGLQLTLTDLDSESTRHSEKLVEAAGHNRAILDDLALHRETSAKTTEAVMNAFESEAKCWVNVGRTWHEVHEGRDNLRKEHLEVIRSLRSETSETPKPTPTAEESKAATERMRVGNPAAWESFNAAIKRQDFNAAVALRNQFL